MRVLDVEPLLAPVAGHQPCGLDLEYDPEFFELIDRATARPEREFGSTRVPALPASWPEVLLLACRLLSRTKDLRVAVLAWRAGLRFGTPAERIDRFATCLQLIAALFDRYGEELHPQRNADDGDTTMRLNALAPLTAPHVTHELHALSGRGEWPDQAEGEAVVEVQLARSFLSVLALSGSPVPEPTTNLQELQTRASEAAKNIELAGQAMDPSFELQGLLGFITALGGAPEEVQAQPIDDVLRRQMREDEWQHFERVCAWLDTENAAV